MKTILRYVSPASTQCIAASFPICMQYLHPQTLQHMYTFLTILHGHTFAEWDVATED